MDGKIDPLDSRFERVDRHFRAANALSGSSEMSFSDYQSLESTMLRWYEAGKLEATGCTKSSDCELTHECWNFSFDEGDRIINSRIDSGPDGISGLAFQSVLNPW